MTNTKTLKASICCLGLIFIAGCTKDVDIEPNLSITSKVETSSDRPALPDASGHIAQLSLSTDFDLNLLFETEGPRALSFSMQERTSNEANIKNFRPRLDLQDPTDDSELVIPVYALMAKKGVEKSVFTQELLFRKKRGSNTLYYRGLITLPEGQVFDEGEWYMMLFANHNPEASRAGLAPSYNSHTAAAYALPVVGSHAGKPISIALNVPYSTEWFRIASSEPGSNYIVSQQSFSFKPDGILIQHELVGDFAEAHQLRAVGIRSNTLSFSGYYDVSSSTVVRTLNQVSDNARRVVPTWVATTQNPIELGRIRDNSVFGVTNAFPWTMPSLHDSKYQKALPLAEQATVAGKGDHSVQILSPKSSQGQIPNAWDVRGRQYVFFWGMPQPTPRGEHPYTYIYADVMNQEEGRQAHYNANPAQLHSDLQRKSQKQSEALEKFNQAHYQAIALRYAYNNALSPNERQRFMTELSQVERQLPQLEQNYQRSLNELKVAQNALERFNAEYMAQVGLSRQNVLVTYASVAEPKADGSGIKPGRIYQSKGIISPDLLITEIAYKYDGQTNYSVVEISNPAQTPRNLKDYAIVRLKSSGGYYAYQRADGSTTMSLAEAKKLLLEDLLLNRDNEERFSHVAPAKTWNFSNGNLGKYPSLSRFWWNTMSDPSGTMPLYSQQSILLCASGYIARPVLRLHKSSESSYDQYHFQNYRCSGATNWFADWLGASEYATAKMPQINQPNKLLALMQTARLRYMAAYDDAVTLGMGQGTLDLARGEGIALLKKNAGGDWYVIDSSVPVGRRNWFYSSDNHSYTSLIATQAGDFSLQRKDIINFPCIPPYRSAQLPGKDGEWVVKPLTEHTLGYRLHSNSVRYQYDELWSVTGSPLSSEKTLRVPQIPVRK